MDPNQPSTTTEIFCILWPFIIVLSKLSILEPQSFVYPYDYGLMFLTGNQEKGMLRIMVNFFPVQTKRKHYFFSQEKTIAI